ncbi:hypothetical protein CEE69_21955 [Rhodopirellula bahusiensis]|uniref:CHAT domain-containing protein n=2 Tax=Rhodopirellula bahusiensis TaxID=2014065 RepID=A0A2G1W257_9BACT|nr:hypothetical protein CEE69_21955 [Rhodopirellula bahusiensis]
MVWAKSMTLREKLALFALVEGWFTHMPKDAEPPELILPPRLSRREQSTFEVLHQYFWGVDRYMGLGRAEREKREIDLADHVRELRTLPTVLRPADAELIEVRLSLSRLRCLKETEGGVSQEEMQRTVAAAASKAWPLSRLWNLFNFAIDWPLEAKSVGSFSQQLALFDHPNQVAELISERVENCSHCRQILRAMTTTIVERHPDFDKRGFTEPVASIAQRIADGFERCGGRSPFDRFYHRDCLEMAECCYRRSLRRDLSLRSAEMKAAVVQKAGRLHRLLYRDHAVASLTVAANAAGDQETADQLRNTLLSRVGEGLLRIDTETLASLVSDAANRGHRKHVIQGLAVFAKTVPDPPAMVSAADFEGRWEAIEAHMADTVYGGLAQAEAHSLLRNHWHSLQSAEGALRNVRQLFWSNHRLQTRELYARTLLKCAELSLVIGKPRDAHRRSVGVLTACNEGADAINLFPGLAETLLEGIAVHAESQVAWGHLSQAFELLDRASEIRQSFEARDYAFRDVTHFKLARAEAVVSAVDGDVTRVKDVYQRLSNWNSEKQRSGVGTSRLFHLETLLSVTHSSELAWAASRPGGQVSSENPDNAADAVLQRYEAIESEARVLVDDGHRAFRFLYHRVMSLKSRMLQRCGRHQEAINLVHRIADYEDTLDEGEWHLVAQDTSVIRTLAMSKALEASGEPRTSREFAEMAVQCLEPVEWEVPVDLSLETLGWASELSFREWRLAGKIERLHDAMRFSKRLIDHGMHTRTRDINPSLRVRVQQTLKAAFDLRVEACYDVDRHTDESVIDQAFFASELARNRLLLDNLTILPPPRPGSVPEELLRELDQAKINVITSEAVWASEDPETNWGAHPVSSSPGSADPVEADSEVENAVDDRPKSSLDPSSMVAESHRYARLLRKVQRHDPDYSATDPIRPATLEDARDLLRNDRTALVQYHVTPRDAFALLVSKTGDARMIKLPDASGSFLEDHFERWSRRFGNPFGTITDRESWQRLGEAIDDSLRSLSEAFIEPVAPHLGGHDHVILVPHVQLHAYPLAAAFCSGSVRLGDLFEVSMLPSVSIGKRILDRQGGVGSETLILSARFQSHASAKFERYAVQSRMGAESMDLSKLSLSEISQASEHARYWHFIGHGHWEGSNPLSSTLRSDSRNRWADLSELYSRLCLPSAEVVTLSACETAMKMPNQVDEFVSFPSAFLYAGAKNVVGSLWKVSDAATTLLMDRFYHYIGNGRSVAGALRLSQRWLRGLDDDGGEALRSGAELSRHLEQVFRPMARREAEYERLRQELKVELASTAAPFDNPASWAAFGCFGLGWRSPGSPKANSR